MNRVNQFSNFWKQMILANTVLEDPLQFLIQIHTWRIVEFLETLYSNRRLGDREEDSWKWHLAEAGESKINTFPTWRYLPLHVESARANIFAGFFSFSRQVSPNRGWDRWPIAKANVEWIRCTCLPRPRENDPWHRCRAWNGVKHV